jgi:anti-sigma regulatory factor (Ser/Thr protein kinase)
VAQVRRAAASAARHDGLDDSRVSHAEIIATEAATNLLKHARGGMIRISRLSAQDGPGVEILATDEGPGRADFDACFRDGFSTSGTPGTGLGAISRLADEFDAYSQVGKGTVLTARIFGAEHAKCNGAAKVTIGAVNQPAPGEEVSGDNWSIRWSADSVQVLMADGLGHGIFAADASAQAISAFAQGGDGPPVHMLERIHRALRGTRGAAVAIASIDIGERRIHFAGLGNISAVISGPGKTQNMVSHNGTAGHEARRLMEFSYDLPESAVVIMHSDGIATSWSLDTYPGLLRRHPSVIAGVLHRDATRRRDDACVVVLRIAGK